MKRITLLAILGIAASVLLAGCAVQNDKTSVSGLGLTYHSNITQNPDGSYEAAVEAALLAGRTGKAQELATADATHYCAGMNKQMVPVNTVTDSHLLVNGVARLTFNCQ